MNPEIQITQEGSIYFLSISTKYKVKIWPWSYHDRQTAEYVKTKIQDRWDDCLVQKYEDYTLVFTEDKSSVQPTLIKIDEMSESWNNTENNKIDLKLVSGYNGV